MRLSSSSAATALAPGRGLGGLLRPLAALPLLDRLIALRAVNFLISFAGFALGLFATWRHQESRGIAGAA